MSRTAEPLTRAERDELFSIIENIQIGDTHRYGAHEEEISTPKNAKEVQKKYELPDSFFDYFSIEK